MPRAGQPLINTPFIGLPCGLCRAHGAVSGRRLRPLYFPATGCEQRRGISSGKDAVEPLERALLRALSEAALLFSGAGVSGTSSGYISQTCTAVSCRSTKRKAPSTGSCPFRVSRRKRNRAVHACCRVRFALWPGLLARDVPSAPGLPFPLPGRSAEHAALPRKRTERSRLPFLFFSSKIANNGRSIYLLIRPP